jgi:putative flippase GtrA
MAKFGIIGVINLGVNFAVFNLLALTVLSDGQLKAKAAATVAATTCAYFMNRHWTYRDRPKSTLRREYTLFFFFNLVGLVIEVAFVGLAKYGLSITNLLALNLFTAVGIGLGTIFRFWSYRTHVFRPVPEMPETAVALPETVVARAVLAESAPAEAAEVAVEDDLAIDRELSDQLAEEIELDGIVLAEERLHSKS